MATHSMLNVLVFVTGFITIGGEWFLTRQDHESKDQQSAFRLIVILSIMLLYLVRFRCIPTICQLSDVGKARLFRLRITLTKVVAKDF
jgi:hypothetical protein